MQADIVAQGIELMLYGMGTVVVFLALLVLATTAMSSIIAKYFPQVDIPQAISRESGSDLRASQDIDPTIVAVITAAIHQHRSRRK